MVAKKLDIYDIALRVIIIILSVMLLVGLHLLRRIYIADQFIIPTNSMKPTLIPGDRVIVNKLIFGARIYDDFDFSEGRPLKSHRVKGYRKIDYNDIIVFNFPINWGSQKIEFKINFVYAKRCIGLPGDNISIHNGYFKNNNCHGSLGNREEQRKLSVTHENMIAPGVLAAIPFGFANCNWTIKEFGPLYVPCKHGTMKITPTNYKLYESVIEYETNKDMRLNENGVLVLNNLPIERYTFINNYYFMSGDNVLDSQDSRYWGLLPEEFIIGVVSHISYSRDRSTNEFRWDRFMKRLK